MFKNITPSLTRAIIVFTLSLIISGTVIAASYLYMEDIESDKDKAVRDMRKWQRKINSSVENNQIIEQFESNFLKLVNQGVVGAEDRLTWFETIQRTAEDRGMPSVKYGVSIQKLLEESNLKKDYSGIDVFKSVMSIDAEMAHEGDLFVLINELQRANGLFAIDSCKIEKPRRLIDDTERTMNATCDLGWYTFKGSNAK